jgi:hypothetical protein
LGRSGKTLRSSTLKLFNSILNQHPASTGGMFFFNKAANSIFFTQIDRSNNIYPAFWIK